MAGLKPYNPNGAMYMMVGVELSKFPHINSTVEFMEKLMCEESVFILPGEVSVCGGTVHGCYDVYFYSVSSILASSG